MSTVRTLRTLLASSPVVWWDAVRTIAVAAIVEVGLRATSVPRVARVLGVRLRFDARPAPAGDISRISLSARERERLDVAWKVVRRRPFNGTCLRRALLGGWILRTREHAVRIGVRKADGLVAAHAWIELDGISLDPTAVETFKTLEPVRVRS